jgi:ABC-type transporter Mla subunit MlaD
MQKQAPSIGRILIAVGFTLSCFGLILFLWIAFGGPIPLKPESYRITAYFPEATQLAQESDVRIGGVSVGKVKTIELAPPDERVDGNDTTKAVIEIDPEFAPISSDARAILRQKTLLGETYVELTSGDQPEGNATPVSLGAAGNASDAETQGVQSIPEGGTLGIGRTQNATQIDEIFNALDAQTRDAFQRWMANAAIGINGRGMDLNDSFGNLGPFLSDADNILAVLRSQKTDLRGLVRDTGTVFHALSERGQELAGAITGSQQTFGALADEQQALADTFKIFPVFERESRVTLDRLDQFQANTRPLVQKLLPVANDISPTFRSVRELSPALKSTLQNLEPLIKASRKGLPATSSFLGALKPVLADLDPFLSNLNPVVGWLNYDRSEIGNFLSGPPAALADTLPHVPGQPAGRHALRQLGYLGAETLSVYPQRLDTNRGNGYVHPGDINGRYAAVNGMFPNFDCDNTGAPGDGTVTSSPPVSEGFAPCIIAKGYPTQFGGERGPQVFADP